MDKELFVKKNIMASCTKQNKRNTVYWGIRDIKDGTEINKDYPYVIEQLIKNMTYKEFMEVFPMKKYGNPKHYIERSIEFINNKNLNDLIGENSTELIYEYENDYIGIFRTYYLGHTEEEIIEEIELLEKPLRDRKGNYISIDKKGKVYKHSFLKVIK
jgi:hypothetical protein